MKRFLLVIGFILLASAALAFLQTRGVSPAVKYENHPHFVEIFRVKIENTVGGTIEVSRDEGLHWSPMGQVVRPADKNNPKSFAAAKWIGAGRVAATAVNAIHVKAGEKDKDTAIFSILPSDFIVPDDDYKSYFNASSSIYTNIPAGESLFGGEYAPYVGNLVMLSRPGSAVISLPAGYIPALGDKIFMIADCPADYPREIVFENRAGGKISIKYFSGVEKVIGEVIQPVAGIGRFEGSEYAGPGRIRANHPGVIDVSVSLSGKIGGFQIVPPLHGSFAQKRPQWMIIGPVNVNDPSLEGIAPFFRYFLRPANVQVKPEDEDWMQKMAGRFLVEVKIKDSSKWQAMPIYSLDKTISLPSWANSALEKVSDIRILFPVNPI
ncbi:MAG: hypothetical protein QME05_06210 [Candidatus Margulisbacteria bacterium]|nr:hypothetical protein [Candidatus Margulisiibacteriota bacterium]